MSEFATKGYQFFIVAGDTGSVRIYEFFIMYGRSMFICRLVDLAHLVLNVFLMLTALFVQHRTILYCLLLLHIKEVVKQDLSMCHRSL